MVIISAQINDNIVKKFRHVIYTKHGLKKGDLKHGLEEAMLDYIQKYSHSTGIKQLATTAKTIPPNNDDRIYNELGEMGADVESIKRLHPTSPQLKGLLEGLKRLYVSLPSPA